MLNVFELLTCLDPCKHLDLVRVCFDAPVCDDESEEFLGWYVESTFFWVELDVVCAEIF